MKQLFFILSFFFFTGNDICGQDTRVLTKKEQIVFNRREKDLKQQYMFFSACSGYMLLAYFGGLPFPDELIQDNSWVSLSR